MQESRLFKIVYYLLEKGRTTAPRLAEKFEVSVRTIYRDIDALSEAGIPVYTEPGRNGGIYLMEDFVLDRAVLSKSEKQEILAALQSLSAAGGMGNTDTLDKLGALFHIPADNWLEVDFSRWGHRQNDNLKFNMLKSAIIHHKITKITYAGASQAISERVIEPLKLIYKSKAWYLSAYCTQKQDYRLFKLTRILEWSILDDSFLPRPLPDQTDTPQQIYNQITLRFPKEMAHRVYDEFDKTEVRPQENGDFTVVTRMPEDAWLTGFLLSFGTQVEVIEPASLRNILAQQAKLIYEKNKPDIPCQ
ncbi:MAG: YafY family transcriptional regulator [Acetatifactor sp.]|nr:YafY family transcriptional regulator [Acetatifactor sp.]